MKKKTSKKAKKSTKTSQKSWRKKIAAARGPEWRKSIAEGKWDAVVNPTALRLARLKKNMEQAELVKRLAEKVPLTLSTYGAIERGKRLVKEDMAKEIAKEFKLPMKKLFTVQGEKFVGRKVRQSL